MPPGPPPDPGSPSSRVQALFADYLARREAGDEPDFDSLCLDNPVEASHLRELRQEWDRVQATLKLAREESGSFAARLRQKYGQGVDPEVSLDAGPAEAPSPATSDLVRRLTQHVPAASRYKLEGEIARGGMGAILRVWDEDLRRHLAMKVVLGKGERPSTGSTPLVDSRQLARFLEEAQVTGQLDHPGIVPVHELGLDSNGRVFFTMKLVKGRDLKRIFDLVFDGKESWNETRALSVILKVCEAMAYAHAKGVIHRDLKPSNVMVGNFGEVFVMDWGLARVLGRKDSHDIRLKPEFPSSFQSVRTERREEREEGPDSPIMTMDGDVVGTPAYMPPEQARGELEKLTARSDVYAIGAMLYHLLARQMPFVPPGTRPSGRAVLMRVLEGPPKNLAELAVGAPAELVSISEKAMAREPSQRYADTVELAEDLRAYLERRVVKAYETGTWAETRKWVQRNKPLAAAVAAAIILLALGVTGTSLFAARSHREAARADNRAAEATLLKNEAVERELAANARTDALWAIQELKEFQGLDDSPEYARGQGRPAYVWWLEKAHNLVDGTPSDPSRNLRRKPGLAEHELLLAEFRRDARSATPAEQDEALRAHPGFPALQYKRAKLLWTSQMLGLEPWPATVDRTEGNPASPIQPGPWAYDFVREDRREYGREHEGLQLLRTYLDAAPPSYRPEAQMITAWALWANGQFSDALRIHDQAIMETPGLVNKWAQIHVDRPRPQRSQWTIQVFGTAVGPNGDRAEWLKNSRSAESYQASELYTSSDVWRRIPLLEKARSQLTLRPQASERDAPTLAGGIIITLNEVLPAGDWELSVTSGPDFRLVVSPHGDANEIERTPLLRNDRDSAVLWESDGIRPVSILAELVIDLDRFYLPPSVELAQPVWPLRTAVSSWTADRDRRNSERVSLEKEVKLTEAQMLESVAWRFSDSDKKWWNEQLVRLVSDLTELKRRIAVAEASVIARPIANQWHEAIESIAAIPVYSGLRITPQLDLLPIGRDIDSGLWEFAHLPTGVAATRGSDGRIEVRPEIGMVMVLLPGGTVPVLEGKEPGPLNSVTLDPFFVSKYELTQEQWSRISPLAPNLPMARDGVMPVRSVSWDDCMQSLLGVGMWLTIPTEAQWEYACRAGTTSYWWTGATADSLHGAANVEFSWTGGRVPIMAVGSLRANSFGLHDTHGNVAEWCLDGWGDEKSSPRIHDGLRDAAGSSAGFTPMKATEYGLLGKLLKEALPKSGYDDGDLRSNSRVLTIDGINTSAIGIMGTQTMRVSLLGNFFGITLTNRIAPWIVMSFSMSLHAGAVPISADFHLTADHTFPSLTRYFSPDSVTFQPLMMPSVTASPGVNIITFINYGPQGLIFGPFGL